MEPIGQAIEIRKNYLMGKWTLRPCGGRIRRPAGRIRSHSAILGFRKVHTAPHLGGLDDNSEGEFLMRPIIDRPELPIGLFGGLAAVLIGALSGSLSAHNMLRRRWHVDELQAEGH